jgi:hypothetical protein
MLRPLGVAASLRSSAEVTEEVGRALELATHEALLVSAVTGLTGQCSGLLTRPTLLAACLACSAEAGLEVSIVQGL